MKVAALSSLFLWSPICTLNTVPVKLTAADSRHTIPHSNIFIRRLWKTHPTDNNQQKHLNVDYRSHGLETSHVVRPTQKNPNIRSYDALSFAYTGFSECKGSPCIVHTASPNVAAHVEINRAVLMGRRGAVKGKRPMRSPVVDSLHLKLLLAHRATSMRALNDLNATGLLGIIKRAIADATMLLHPKDLEVGKETTAVINSAKSAIHALGGHSDVKLQLNKVTRPLSGKAIQHPVSIRNDGVLSVSATAIVFLCSLLDDFDQAEMGGDSFAVKVFYRKLDGVRFLASLRKRGEIRRLLETESLPLTLLKARTGLRSEKEAILQKGWDIPLFAARLGRGWWSMVSKGDFVFGKNVLISEPMAGDISVFQDEFMGRSLPRPAKYYICKRMIETVAALHVEGACHYNIKPESFSVRSDGTVLLTNFGASGMTGKTRKCRHPYVPSTYQDPTHAACFLRGGTLRLTEAQDSWAVGVLCYSVFLGGKLPYGIPSEEDPTKAIASLATSCLRGGAECLNPTADIARPRQEMQQAGIGSFWASLVSFLLTRDRSQRPVLRQIVAAFDSLPLLDTSA